MLREIIDNVSIKSNADKYVIASNPEFLAEGTAVEDLLKPDRVVLGSLEKKDISKLSNLYSYVAP